MCYLARMAFFSIFILISTSVSFRLRGGSCLSHGDCFFKAREDGEEAWRRGEKNEAMFRRREGISWLSSTTKSIEEIATTVLQEVGLDRG